MSTAVATSVLTQIVAILTGALSSMASGIGSGLNSLVTEFFLTTTGSGESAVTTLSTFGAVVIVFAGVSLAVGLSRLVFNFITHLGK